MNQGIPLPDFLNMVQRADQDKVDFIAKSDLLRVDFAGEKLLLAMTSQDGLHREVFELTDRAHRQLAAMLNVPWKYWSRLCDDYPELICENANTLLANETPRTRMIRALRNEDRSVARALVSDQYKRIDNRLVVNAATSALTECGDGLVIMSANVDEFGDSLYLKAIDTGRKAIIESAGKERPISPGVVISNSETGGGRVRVTGFTYDGWCTNGCVWRVDNQIDYARTHLGKKIESVGVFAADTLEAEAELTAKEIRDVTNAVLSQEGWNRMVEVMRNAASSTPVKDLKAAVTLAANRYSLTETETEKMLLNMAAGQDRSQFGLSSAVTSVANDTEDYQRATELEQVGGEILSLQLNQWRQFAYAEAA